MRLIPIRYRWREIWVGMQLICGSEKCILIDSGIDDAVNQALLPEMKLHNIPLSSLALVINTHNHDDHNGGNAELRQCTDTDFAGADRSGGYDIVLSDGMEIKIDNMALEIVHTPGHSPDSICVIEKRTKTLFSGDSIQGRGIKELGLPLWQDSAVYLKSMKKLQRLHSAGKFTRLYTGHQFQPCSGVLNGDGIADFLQISIESAESYVSAAQKFKHLDLQRFYRKILSEFALKPCPLWENTAVNMANILQQEANIDSAINIACIL